MCREPDSRYRAAKGAEMKEEQGYIIEEHEDYEVHIYDDGSYTIEPYVEPLDADPEYIKFMEEKKKGERK